jgi:hypothetical protein
VTPCGSGVILAADGQAAPRGPLSFPSGETAGLAMLSGLIALGGLSPLAMWHPGGTRSRVPGSRGRAFSLYCPYQALSLRSQWPCLSPARCPPPNHFPEVHLSPGAGPSSEPLALASPGSLSPLQLEGDRGVWRGGPASRWFFLSCHIFISSSFRVSLRSQACLELVIPPSPPPECRDYRGVHHSPLL